MGVQWFVTTRSGSLNAQRLSVDHTQPQSQEIKNLMSGLWSSTFNHRSLIKRQPVSKQSRSDSNWLQSLSERFANNYCGIYKCRLTASTLQSIYISLRWCVHRCSGRLDSAGCILVIFLYTNRAAERPSHFAVKLLPCSNDVTEFLFRFHEVLLDPESKQLMWISVHQYQQPC